MNWLDKLEKHFGFLAVPGLIRIVAGFTGLVFLLSLDPNFYSVLDLRPALIRRGEVWRLVTYIFLPPGNLAQQFGWLWAVFAVVGRPNTCLMALLFAFGNYLIFVGPEFISRARHRREVAGRRQRFEEHSRSDTEPLHKCAVCGATELTDPNLDFRVASDGEEYCVAHLPSAQTAKR